MIRVEGVEYGQADEIAALLGPDVTPAMVRNWGRRDGLRKITQRDPDGILRTRYPLRQAALIEAAKRATRRGRPRVLAPTAKIAA